MTTTPRPYAQIRGLIENLGGTMTFAPMGAGGDWVLSLHGRTATVPCRDQNVNALDRLYIAKVATPETWADYDASAPLVGDAFWRLVEIFHA